MATTSWIIREEQSILELINAIKIEALANGVENNSSSFKCNKENYELWFSVRENARLLINELDKYMRM